MQSTAHKALASLQHKFQAKIREVGQLKRQLETSDSTVKDRALAVFERDLRAAKQTIERQEFDLRTYEREGGARVVLAAQLEDAQADVRSLKVQRDNLTGLLRDAKDEATNWKHLSALGVIVGISIGILGTLAYIAQTTGQL